MRFHPTRGGISVGKSQGGMAPDSLAEDEGAILEDMKRMIAEYHDNSRRVLYISLQGRLPVTLYGLTRKVFLDYDKSCIPINASKEHLDLKAAFHGVLATSHE